MNTTKLVAIATTYARAAVPAVVALYAAGITDPKTLANAFVAGLLGPAAKFVNPKDPSYGFGKK